MLHASLLSWCCQPRHLCPCQPTVTGVADSPETHGRSHQFLHAIVCVNHDVFSQVPVDGLRTVAGGVALSEVAAEIVRIAHAGLRRRGLGEGIYLQPLHEIVAAGKSNSEITARRFREDWGGRVEPLLQAHQL